MTHFGYHVNKGTVQTTIKNNLGASYYTFRYKPHYIDEWSYYPLNPASSRGYDLFDAYSVPCQASSSNYTIIPLTFLQPIPEGGKVDVQVQALFGDFKAVPYGHVQPMPAPTYDFYFEGTTSDWSETVTFVYDFTPPRIIIISPQQQRYFTSNVSLTFSVDEQPYQVAYSLDGEENTTILGNTTLTGLSDGSHNITVYAWDMVGNVGASETIFFDVKATFLTEIVVIAAVVSVVLVGIGLLVYFKKRNRKEGKHG